MIKRIIMVLLAFAVFGAVECQAAPKKSSSKAARQKGRRTRKNQKNKLQREAVAAQRLMKEIHQYQDELVRYKGDAAMTKKYVDQINSAMKKLTPLLKPVGNVPGVKFMTDIDKLIAEGKKLVVDPSKVVPEQALDVLKKHQLELLEKYRDKVNE